MANKKHEEAHIKDEDLRAQASASTGELGTAGSDEQGNVTLGAGGWGRPA